jgi:hypothetical protein
MALLCRELEERVAGFQVVDCLPNDRQRFFLSCVSNIVKKFFFSALQLPFSAFTYYNHPLFPLGILLLIP